MPSAYALERKIAIEAVLKASLLAKKMQGKVEAQDIIHKEDLSPVTITDFSCQAIINSYLSRYFPHDPIMGEEDSLLLRTAAHRSIAKRMTHEIGTFFPDMEEEEILYAIDKGGWKGGREGRFWVLDPIDGTKGFINDGQYALALALIEEGRVVLGVLGCPRLVVNGKEGALFTAVRGLGATYRPLDEMQDLPLAQVQSTSKDRLVYCEPHLFSLTHAHSEANKIAHLLHANPEVLRLDSQCRYAAVALQSRCVYLRVPIKNEEAKIWDHAPGSLLVEEAGGTVTDLRGHPLDFGDGDSLKECFGILASIGLNHQEAVAASLQVLFPTDN